MYKTHTIQTILQLFFRNLTRTHKKVAHTSVTDCVRQMNNNRTQIQYKMAKTKNHT